MTEDEAKRFYGTDAAEWLRRWDAGDIVWSIEMGGLGPGYEQAIQITTAEVLRALLAMSFDVARLDVEDIDARYKVRDEIAAEANKNGVIAGLELSGTQWDAAFHLALHLYRKGPAVVMSEDAVKDRHIQVQRTFPGMVPA